MDNSFSTINTMEQKPESENGPPVDMAEVKRYQRQKLLLGLAALIFGVGYLVFMAVVGGRWLEDWLQSWPLANRWLRLVVFAFLFALGAEILTLPFDFASSYIVEHRYQLSTQTLGGWFWKRLKGYTLGGIIGLPLLLGLYALLWTIPDWWWLAATGGWLLVTLGLGELLPVLILPLFYKVTRLDDPDLLGRLQRLAEGTGLRMEGVYRLHLSQETRKANAALAGLGRTRRVLLGDTLLDQFRPEEIEVVFAHELGHHVHGHLPKLVVTGVVLSAAGFWLCDWVLKHLAGLLGHESFAAVSALPLLLLVLTLFGLLLAPAQNALSRYFERQCDRYALERTRNASAYRSAFEKLARLNKSDPDPSRLVVWLFYDHPPIRDRLAMASPTDEGQQG